MSESSVEIAAGALGDGFDIVDDAGRRRTVWPATADDSVGDLADALGFGPAALTIDGTIVPADHRLVDVAGLRAGVSVGAGVPQRDLEQSGEPVCEVAVVSGATCTGWRPLLPGRHGIGRAPGASIRLDDPTVEPYHAVLDVASDGGCRFLQLTGWVPATVVGDDDRRLTITLRAHRIEVRPRCDAGSDATRAGSLAPDVVPWRRVVRRGPPQETGDAPVEVAPPQEPTQRRSTPATGLIGAATSALVALVAATVFGSAMFAVFGLLAASVSTATWLVGRVGAGRDHRRERRRYATECRTFIEEVESLGAGLAEARARRTPSLPSVLDALERLHRDATTEVWERRSRASGDAVRDAGSEVYASVGNGRVRLPIEVEGGVDLPADLAVAIEQQSTCRWLPARLTLRRGDIVALHGDTAIVTSVARAVAIQLATWYGPADVRLAARVADRDTWRWMDWLPHTDDKPPEAPRAAGDSTAPLPVLFVDDLDVLIERAGPVRRALDESYAAAIVVVPTDATVPACCTRTLRVGTTATASWSGDIPSSDRVEALTIAGLDAGATEQAARSLASLVDPESIDGGVSPPSDVTLDDLDRDLAPDDADDPLPQLAMTICERWRSSTGRPVTVVGCAGDSTLEVDLVRDGPHALVAGTTGSGKSELLRTLVAGMATRSAPTDLAFVLVDYKGGAAFDACVRLPHVVGLVTDLEHGLAERALQSIDAELRRREQSLRGAGVSHFDELASATGRGLARIVVIVDEFASLAAEQPDFLAALVAAAQRGRSLGIHLILATQRPAGVVSEDIAANTDLRVALRVRTSGESRDVIDDAAAASISKRTPGRAVLRAGDADPVVFQTAQTMHPPRRRHHRLRVLMPGPPDAEQQARAPLLEQLVAGVRRATERAELPPPDPLWLPPLPPRIEAAELAGVERGAIGLIDDPGRQTRHPLRWSPGDGGLLLVGEAGSGVTTTVRRIVESACDAATPDELHVYVLDAIGDPALETLRRLPHCGGVVRRSEHERIARVVRRLQGRLDGGARTPRVLLAIDGHGVLRDSLLDAGWLDLAAELRAVIEHGPAVGVETVRTASSAPSDAIGADRWTFEPPARAGPGRLRIGSTGLEAQVAWSPPATDRIERSTPAIGGPARIGALPPFVDIADIAAAHAGGRDSVHRLTIGRRFDDLDAATLVVPHDDHVLIVGQARTGRTTTLQTIAEAWRQAHPDGGVVSVDARTAPGAGASAVGEMMQQTAARSPSDTPLLLAIDNAERLVDHDGTVQRLLDGSAPVTVVAAARLDAVRSAYGHWTRAVCQSRCGVVLTSAGEVDGDLFGVSLPRRSIVAPRPGLAWLIDGDGPRLAQIAARLPP